MAAAALARETSWPSTPGEQAEVFATHALALAAAGGEELRALFAPEADPGARRRSLLDLLKPGSDRALAPRAEALEETLGGLFRQLTAEEVELLAPLLRAAEATTHDKRVAGGLGLCPGLPLVPPEARQTLLRLVGGRAPVLAPEARSAVRELLASEGFGALYPQEQGEKLTAFIRGFPAADVQPYTPAGTFDARRRPFEIGKAEDLPEHPFDSGAGPARRYAVTIAEREIAVVVAETPVADGEARHSVEELARGLATLPDRLLGKVTEVRIEPRRNPQDEFWTRVYGIADFRSYMTAGASGVVSVYPTLPPLSPQSTIDGTLVHEAGHVLSRQLWGVEGETERWQAWRAAQAADSIAPSGYARSSPGEDFSEALWIYEVVRGTPAEAELRPLMAGRFAIIDRMLAEEPPPEPK